MIRTSVNFFAVLLMGFFLIAPDVEAAKRFGGGKSFGKSYSTPKKAPAPVTSPTAQQSAGASKTAAPAAQPKSSGMKGMLGGLLAGGLLGALFFGGAFDGIQLMDILIVGLIGFLIFKLLARAKAPQPKPQYAGGHMPEAAPTEAAEPQPQARSSYGAGFEPTPLMSTRLAEASLNLPAWFNKDAFLEGAKQHFTALQAAWDRNDLEEIRSYTSPELFEELKAERARLDDQGQHTEVVSVMTELLNFLEEDNEVVLSINFYGWIREGANAETREFNEIWHLSRAKDDPKADWFIVGIEQPNGGF